MPEPVSNRSSIPLDAGLLIMRLGIAALLFGLHGWARLGRAWDYAVLGEPWGFVNVVAELGFPFAGAFAVASALAESVGAVLLALGLYARAAALLIAINMGVALLNEAIGGDPLELPALYFIAVLGFTLTGAGAWSLDGVRFGRAWRFLPRWSHQARPASSIRSAGFAARR